MNNKNIVYVVYTKNEKDFMEVNDLHTEIVIDRVFDNKYKAMAYLESEIDFQCSKFILANGKEKILDNEDDLGGWVAQVIEDTDNKFVVEFYYYEDLQYTTYIKATEVLQ